MKYPAQDKLSIFRDDDGTIIILSGYDMEEGQTITLNNDAAKFVIKSLKKILSGKVEDE